EDATEKPQPAPETPKEAREALRATIERFEEKPAPSIAPLERSIMQEREKEYLNAYRELERKRTVWGRLSKGKELGAEMARVEALKREYDEARVSYGNALTASAEKRLSEKGGDSLRADAVLDRYNRIVRFREVMKPAVERKLAARKEAL